MFFSLIHVIHIIESNYIPVFISYFFCTAFSLHIITSWEASTSFPLVPPNDVSLWVYTMCLLLLWHSGLSVWHVWENCSTRATQTFDQRDNPFVPWASQKEMEQSVSSCSGQCDISFLILSPSSSAKSSYSSILASWDHIPE